MRFEFPQPPAGPSDRVPMEDGPGIEERLTDADAELQAALQASAAAHGEQWEQFDALTSASAINTSAGLADEEDDLMRAIAASMETR